MLMAESFHLLHDQSHEGKLYDCKHPALDDSAWSSRGLCPVIPAHGLTYHEFKVIPTLIDFFVPQNLEYSREIKTGVRRRCASQPVDAARIKIFVQDL